MLVLKHDIRFKLGVHSDVINEEPKLIQTELDNGGVKTLDPATRLIRKLQQVSEHDLWWAFKFHSQIPLRSVTLFFDISGKMLEFMIFCGI